MVSNKAQLFPHFLHLGTSPEKDITGGCSKTKYTLAKYTNSITATGQVLSVGLRFMWIHENNTGFNPGK